MGIVVRQSIKSVIVTLGGVGLGALVIILSTRFFPKAELGFTQNLIKIALQISYLGLFGFNYTLLIFGQKYPPGHEARGTFLTLSAIIPLLFSLLVTIAYFILKSTIIGIYNIEDAAMMHQYFLLFPLLTFLTTIINWLEGYLQSLHKTALQNFAREILARIIYITLIILFGTGIINFDTFIWLYVILYLIPLSFLLWIAIRTKGFRFEYKHDLFSLKERKELLRFSGYHMLTVMSSVLLLQLDAILLAPLDDNGFKAVAVYSVAALVVSMLRNPTRIIGLAATPALTQSYNEGNMDQLKKLFIRSALNMQIIGIGMFTLVYLNIGNIQEVMGMIKGGYNEIKWIILILMIGQLADMVTGLNFELIGVTKHYRFNFWIAIVLLIVVLILNFILIQKIGINGAAWATTIGLIIFNIGKTIFLWKKLNMQPFNKASFYIFLSAFLVAIPAWILPQLGNVFVDGMIRCLIFCGLWWALLYRFKISDDLNEITHNLITKRRFY